MRILRIPWVGMFYYACLHKRIVAISAPDMNAKEGVEKFCSTRHDCRGGIGARGNVQEGLTRVCLHLFEVRVVDALTAGTDEVVHSLSMPEQEVCKARLMNISIERIDSIGTAHL
jgi:hypothetical protein